MDSKAGVRGVSDSPEGMTPQSLAPKDQMTPLADAHLTNGKVRARCRVKVALRHTCLVLRMRTLVRHMHDVARYTLAGLCAQSPEFLVV